jgi:hypothetical protein
MYLTLQSSPWIDIDIFNVNFFKVVRLQYDFSFFFGYIFQMHLSYIQKNWLTSKIAIVTSIKIHYSVLSLF